MADASTPPRKIGAKLYVSPDATHIKDTNVKKWQSKQTPLVVQKNLFRKIKGVQVAHTEVSPARSKTSAIIRDSKLSEQNSNQMKIVLEQPVYQECTDLYEMKDNDIFETPSVCYDYMSAMLGVIQIPGLCLNAPAAEFDAQMAEITLALRTGTNATGSQAGTTAAGGLDRGQLQLPSRNRTKTLTQLKAVFARLDINGDGTITADEVMSSLRTHVDIGEVLGLHGSGDEMAFEAGRIFSELDTDGDHHIDIDEFV